MNNLEKVKLKINQKSRKNKLISFSIIGVIGFLILVGYATGIVTYNPIIKDKNNTFNKSEQCFEKLKGKHSKKELLDILSKKKFSESYCDYL